MLTPSKTVLRNKSGTITTGGTAQDVYDKRDGPKYYFLFQNISDTAMFIDFGRTATSTSSIKLGPGEAWEPPAGVIFTGNLSVLCATTGKAFVCKLA